MLRQGKTTVKYCCIIMEKASKVMETFGRMTELIYKFVRKMGRDRIRAHSAEAAFFTIMSAFPVLMLLLTLVQFTPLTQEQVMFTLEEITPFQVTELLEPVVSSIFNQSSALVPWTALAALWSAGKGIMGLADGLNSVYQIEEPRGYFATRFRSAFYTVVMIVALVVSLAILVFGYGIQNHLQKIFPLLEKYSDTMLVLPTLIAVAILILAFTVLYMFLPNHRMRFFSQIPGAVFSSVAWAVFSYAFSIYLDFAVNMSVIYGSLTTLIVVMLWLYSCMYLLFIGAEINHYIAQPELFVLDR